MADIYINPREHHGQSTINVMAGDANDPKHTGPVFQLSWYGHEDPKEKLAKGDNVRVRASVGVVYEFDPHQFYLVDEGVNARTEIGRDGEPKVASRERRLAQVSL
ncbi:hypothetical protein P9990_25060 (plasmid) [Prescottella equi]|uniref:hypothetical protein n=1 Tax=Rhodococcus hoagii TaxID=43767 RepID=UPI00257759A1|nr:hypothetical protein [Prescottella equi]WJJ14467.1 hypothetical protein P9990_25060 [Prescottella equi]